MNMNYVGKIILMVFIFVTAEVNSRTISYVDTRLENSQKYYLVVDGKPFFPIGIQVRIDLMRYMDNWTDRQREALIKQLSEDGFNMVNIPIHWYEIEPDKEHFKWDILDEYLTLAKKYDLKLELLWFGANSGGHVQWLSWKKDNPVHLRVPDYVLYAPKYGNSSGEGFQETTSDYTVSRERSNYTMDLNDNRLREREKYVVGKMMEHIARWNEEEGNPDNLAGIQIGNEVVGYKLQFPNALVISYLNDVAKSVKESDYNVWTRVNCVFWNYENRIAENERLKEAGKSFIDFVGMDTYRHHLPSDSAFIESMRDNIPYIGKNFRIIMETNANLKISPQMRMSALSGNNNFNYYDSFGLYDKDLNNPKGIVRVCGDETIEALSNGNSILSDNMEKIATKAHGYGLYVYNHSGTSIRPDTSNHGITFIPADSLSQGLSIMTEDKVFLSATGDGTFQIPADLNDTTSVNISGGKTKVLYLKSKELIPSNIYQAECAALDGFVNVESKISNIGFAGNGYVLLPSSEGATVSWYEVDGADGGESTIGIRYSLSGERGATHVLSVNGKADKIELEPTGANDKYVMKKIKVKLKPGKTNAIILESGYNYYRPDRVVVPAMAGNIDELQIIRD